MLFGCVNYLVSFSLKHAACFLVMLMNVHLTARICPCASPFVSICLYRSLSVSIGLYRSLSVSIGLYRSLSVSIGLYRSLSVSIGLYRSLSVSVGLCMSLSVSISLFIYVSFLYVCISVPARLGKGQGEKFNSGRALCKSGRVQESAAGLQYLHKYA